MKAWYGIDINPDTLDLIAITIFWIIMWLWEPKP